MLLLPFQLGCRSPANGLCAALKSHDEPAGQSRLPGIFLAALLVAGFSAPAFADRQIIKMTIDDVKRSALGFSPSNPGDAKLPLVFVFHGRGDDNGKFARAVRLHKDWKNAVVVYPRGLTIDTKPPMRGWQSRVGQYADRDLKFTDRLLQRLTTMFAVDPQKTYVAGFSNGGHFTFLLLKERADSFVAYAVIGALHPDFQSDTAPKPFIYLFGRQEGTQYQDQWVKTGKALARHNQASGERTMAIRLRTVGEIRVAMCAAETDLEEGDVYLDDADHYDAKKKQRGHLPPGPGTPRHDDGQQEGERQHSADIYGQEPPDLLR